MQSLKTHRMSYVMAAIAATIALTTPVAKSAVNVQSSSWIWQNPLPQGDTLNAISCPATNICYAVGNEGTILYFNGNSWSGQFSTVNAGNLNGISCPTSTTCFAVGDFATIVATTNSGASWTRLNSGIGGGTIAKISCPTTSVCFALVPTIGVIYTTLGNNTASPWISLPGTGPGLHDISCPSVTECYLVSSSSVSRSLLMNGFWTSPLPTSPVPTNGSFLEAISCVSSSTCALAGASEGSGGTVFGTSNFGSSWSSVSLGNPLFLRSISCMNSLTFIGPSPFCFAVGNSNKTTNEVYTGGITSTSWTAVPAPISNSLTLYGVSCQPAISGTAPFVFTVGLCHAVGSQGTILANNSSDVWSSQETLLSPNPPSLDLTLHGTSCPSPGTCFAVGDALYSSVSSGPWTKRNSSGGYAISCPTTLTCFITAGNGVAVTTDGGTTERTFALPSFDSLQAISCPSSQVCFAGGRELWSTTNGGLTWTAQANILDSSAVGMSCPSTTSCVAVGPFGLILFTADGQHWHSSASPTANDLNAVSCPAPSSCFIAGNSGTILAGSFNSSTSTWTWTPQIAAPTSATDLASISCVPAVGTFPISCQAGGFHGELITGPGTWKLEASVDPSIAALSCARTIRRVSFDFVADSFECAAVGGEDAILTKSFFEDVIGAGVLTPSDGSSEAGDRTAFMHTWTVPIPHVWRDLQYVELKMVDQYGVVGLWARFIPGNPTSVFALLDANGNIVSEGAPGTEGVLDSPIATLDLSQSSFQGTGPTGPGVTVNFVVSFKDSQVGQGVSQNAEHVYNVEIAAANVNGVVQTPEKVGSWAVRAAHY
jgi:photosystem II stability/assembly factor-like uncharacterized protein